MPCFFVTLSRLACESDHTHQIAISYNTASTLSANLVETSDSQKVTSDLKTNKKMKKFVIERDLPGAGQLSAEELAAINNR